MRDHLSSLAALLLFQLVAWSTEKFGKDGPQSWADFWNVEKFPGRRSLRNDPAEVLEAIRAAYQGAVVAQVHLGNQVADVAVILDEASRREPEGITDVEERTRLEHAAQRMCRSVPDHRPVFDHA